MVSEQIKRAFGMPQMVREYFMSDRFVASAPIECFSVAGENIVRAEGACFGGEFPSAEPGASPILVFLQLCSVLL